MKPLGRTRNVLVQPLQNEVVLYDGTAHQAHCVSKTVFTVWQNADGRRSIDQLAELVSRDLSVACSREIVLLALEDLRHADLLEDDVTATPTELPSRRDVARKLSVAGLSLSLLPFVASMAAPTPAMARSGNYTSQNYNQWLAQAESEASARWTQLLGNTNGSWTDLQAAISDGQAGLSAASHGQQTAAQTDFASALSEFNAMLQALGLPPL